MLVRTTVWSSNKVFYRGRYFVENIYSSSVCNVSRCWRLVFLLHAAVCGWNVCGLEDVSRCCKNLVLTLRRRNIFGLSAYVRSQNCCCCLDANSLICDREIRTEGSLIGHGYYPLLAMVYKCFNIYLLLYRVYLEYLQVQVRSGEIWWFWSLLRCRTAQTRQMFSYGWRPFHC